MGRRHAQFPRGTEGMFMRASLPKPKMSWAGTMAVRATEEKAMCRNASWTVRSVTG
ncbi:MAG: hypothetical protein BWY88_00176 [Synergistetes bacterium ADurb.Bin520]|nr:MAG: hypothetical protein BWY88_00176 [Synergistetes bacterium ADurb.Bin520]